MMQIANYLSIVLIPLVVFYIVGYGLLSKRPVFQDFLKGAMDGFRIVIDIAPTIVGLFVAVSILRNSGALDVLCNFLKPIASFFGIPTQIIPVGVIKLFSSSGANGLLCDLFKNYGPDSYVGIAASIMLSCTETLFYTVSVYLYSNGIKKVRWILWVGVLLLTISMFVSIVIARIYCVS